MKKIVVFVYALNNTPKTQFLNILQFCHFFAVSNAKKHVGPLWILSMQHGEYIQVLCIRVALFSKMLFNLFVLSNINRLKKYILLQKCFFKYFLCHNIIKIYE